MGYERQIKYVDYYENGERVKGGGFVKTEVRDGRLRMELNVRGLYPTDTFVRDVVLKCGDTEAVLGQISLREGQGRFEHSCSMDRSIGDTGIAYDALEEIRVPVGGSRDLSCIWRKKAGKAEEPEDSRKMAAAGEPEDEGTKTKVKEPEDKGTAAEVKEPEDEGTKTKVKEPEDKGTAAKAREPEDKGTAAEVKEPENKGTAARVREPEDEGTAARVKEPAAEVKELENEGTAAGVRGPEDEEAAKVREPEEDIRGAEGAPKAEDTEKTEKVWKAEEVIGVENIGVEKPDGKEAAGQGAAEENPERKQLLEDKKNKKRAVKLLEEKWQQISAIYPHIRPFHDEREYLSLGPSDFVLFPEKFYRAVNNSFLLHGYYNYEHLILARLEQRGEAKYYLGVPGNYYDREKQVAVMFGFESFECDREPAKSGDFGYYMMRVEL